eukprot:537582_1
MFKQQLKLNIKSIQVVHHQKRINQLNKPKSLSKYHQNYLLQFLGSNPPTNGDISLWNVSSFDSPYPYSYTLVSISDLFTTMYTPNESSSNLTTKQNNIISALQKYCGLTPGCGLRQPDITPQYIQQVQSSVSNSYSTASCGQEFNVISCGFASKDKNNADLFWGVWPSDDHSCQGHDDSSGTIYAVCAPKNIVGKWKSVPKQLNADGNVYCPSGFNLTGCGFEPSSKGYESHQMIIPYGEQNLCYCYDYYGGTCYAICSDSVVSSRLYQSHAVGLQTVSCQDEPSIFS